MALRFPFMGLFRDPSRPSADRHSPEVCSTRRGWSSHSSAELLRLFLDYRIHYCGRLEKRCIQRSEVKMGCAWSSEKSYKGLLDLLFSAVSGLLHLELSHYPSILYSLVECVWTPIRISPIPFRTALLNPITLSILDYTPTHNEVHGLRCSGLDELRPRPASWSSSSRLSACRSSSYRPPDSFWFFFPDRSVFVLPRAHWQLRWLRWGLWFPWWTALLNSLWYHYQPALWFTWLRRLRR